MATLQITVSVSQKCGIIVMEITFATKKLQRIANNDSRMVAALGKLRAQKFRLRLSQLADATMLEDVRHLAGNYHELRADRKGQWSCDLDQPYRLIFTPHERPIPMNDAGQYQWSLVRGVEVVEIVNYHNEK